MKRFTETEKWRDPWFQKLDRPSRTLWLWLCDRVDNAGVVDICWPILNAETGETFCEDSMLALGDKVEKLENGKWWIPKFVKFQFGELSKDSKVHQSIEKLLVKHSLSHRVTHRVSNMVAPTIKEKDKEKDKDKAKDSGFMEFWGCYPKKVGKGNVEKIWDRIKPSKELVDKILQSVEAHRRSDQWMKDGGQFIPNPATWLNQKRWEDEIFNSVFIKISAADQNAKVAEARRKEREDIERLRQMPMVEKVP